MATAKKAPAKKAAPAPKTAPAKTTAVKKAVAPAKKVVPAKAAAPAKAVKAAPVKAAPAKKAAAPAKKAAVKAAAPAPKAAAKKAAVKKVATKRTVNAAFMKALTPSSALAAIVGGKPLPRTEVVKQMWVYIKKHNLQDAVNKRLVNADAKLKEVFGKAQVTMFEMAGLIGKHLK